MLCDRRAVQASTCGRRAVYTERILVALLLNRLVVPGRVYKASDDDPLVSSQKTRSVRHPINTCRIQNLDIPQAGRVGAAPGGAAGRGGAGQDGRPTERFAQGTTVPRTAQGIKHNCF